MARYWFLLFALCSAALATSTDSTPGGEGKRTQEEVQFGNQQNKPEGMVDDALAAGYFPSSEKKDSEESGDTSSSTPTSQVSSSANPSSDESEEVEEEPEGRAKSAYQYEKGFKYSNGKDTLHRNSENAILKSEAFGYPPSMNEYQYYRGGDRLRRSAAIRSAIAKRSSSFNPANRFKRELDREDVLTLLALLAAEQQEYPPRTGAMRYDNDYGDYSEIEGAGDDAQDEDEDNDNDDSMVPYPVVANEDWLRAGYLPALPKRKGQAVRRRRLPWEINYGPRSNSMRQRQLARTGQWGDFPTNGVNKRFMVSKRNQGPSAGEDVYSLAQLLGGPRRDFTEYNHPVYRRFMV